MTNAEHGDMQYGRLVMLVNVQHWQCNLQQSASPIERMMALVITSFVLAYNGKTRLGDNKIDTGSFNVIVETT